MNPVPIIVALMGCPSVSYRTVYSPNRGEKLYDGWLTCYPCRGCGKCQKEAAAC